MRGMTKFMKPIIVIVLAVGVAAGAAVFLSRSSEQPTEASTSAGTLPNHVEIKGGGHVRGSDKAQLTLVEFGDYQCPSCGAYHPFVKEVLNRYPDKVKLEFHHYPLVTIHPNSFAAAKAVEAAGEQGHYWEMHDAVFEYQNAWSDKPDPKPIFAALANRIGINGTILVQTMESPEIQARILKDIERGETVKIEAVPTFFINGERVHITLSMEDFAQVIDARLHNEHP
jgi:protein-disulfide isomerase